MIEIESKFDWLGAQEDVSVLLDWLHGQGHAVRSLYRDDRIVDRYFDTSDYRLERLRASLRIRQQADQLLLTFKLKRPSDRGVLSRVELEAPPTPDHLAQVRQTLQEIEFPANLRDTVPDLTLEDTLLGWGLEERLAIHNRRSAFAILRGELTCCTLTLDRVTFHHGSRTADYTGIEIEASAPDQLSLVADISDALATAFPGLLARQSMSKYEMGLELLART